MQNIGHYYYWQIERGPKENSQLRSAFGLAPDTWKAINRSVISTVLCVTERADPQMRKWLDKNLVSATIGKLFRFLSHLSKNFFPSRVFTLCTNEMYIFICQIFWLCAHSTQINNQELMWRLNLLMWEKRRRQYIQTKTSLPFFNYQCQSAVLATFEVFNLPHDNNLLLTSKVIKKDSSPQLI